jgi:hypothetical protein
MGRYRKNIDEVMAVALFLGRLKLDLAIGARSVTRQTNSLPNRAATD